MPRKVWHNVPMNQAVAVPVTPPPVFKLDWEAARQGVPLAALEEFSAYSGFEIKDLLEVVINPRTLKHRRQKQEPLSIDEADRLARVARLYDLGVKVFGNPEKARRWLSRPRERFEGISPLGMMRTELGGLQIEEMLIQIDEGMFV
jgi:putative toxin-antitoxin system antitoxin component (TIGR02293 family)